MTVHDRPYHVHFIGIGGSGMSSLAGLFKQAGWQVSGCDKGIVYPPASLTLDALGIMPKYGFDPAHLDTPTDLIIVGNIVRRDNHEDRAARDSSIPRLHMAAALYDYFIRNKSSVVVSGTHGKTTSSSLLAYLLDCMRLDPGYFIGGVIRTLGKSYHLGTGDYFITEGDEYDCAWFDKQPKFLHYFPHFLLITNVEFDHADIYDSITDIENAFTKLISRVPADGCIVYCKDSPRLEPLIRYASCRVVSYSSHDHHADWRWEKQADDHDDQRFSEYAIYHKGDYMGRFRTKLLGRHNASNITGVLALIRSMGLDFEAAMTFVSSFAGAERRMQIRTAGNVILVDDFAHHPTEIDATLTAIRQQWPSASLWALYEPKTQTSRRAVFQDETAHALSRADTILILEPEEVQGIPPDSRIDIEHICDYIRTVRKPCYSFGDIDSLQRFLIHNIDVHNTVIVILTAGNFNGLCPRLIDEITQRGWGSPVESTDIHDS